MEKTIVVIYYGTNQIHTLFCCLQFSFSFMVDILLAQHFSYILYHALDDNSGIICKQKQADTSSACFCRYENSRVICYGPSDRVRRQSNFIPRSASPSVFPSALRRNLFLSTCTGRSSPATDEKKPTPCGADIFGPSDRVRTCGLMVPNHPRYQLRYTRILRLSGGD